MDADRRSARRVAFRDGILPPRARLRPGGDVVLVNLSNSGALVEGTFRVRPDARCEVSVTEGARESTLRGLVVRSFVARLDRAGPVRYRAAIRFDRTAEWTSSMTTFDGYRITEALAALDGPRVAATREPRRTGPARCDTARYLRRGTSEARSPLLRLLLLRRRHALPLCPVTVRASAAPAGAVA